MSDRLARARLLLAQSRPADAEREAGLAVAAEPEDTAALAVLALSLAEQRKMPAALEAARRAIGLAPDAAHLHYIHASVLHRADLDDQARQAVAEAIRLDPEDADNFSLLASIELAERDWPGALAAAERALALNPEHIGAANLRAMALVRLGRTAEAEQTMDFALQRAPENAFSHANQGWNRLHQNRPREAQVHFREALRLAPDLEYARQGMLEALRARNPIYRAMLAYFLWMGRLRGPWQWAVIIGAIAGGSMLRGAADTNPWLWPALALFYLFVYLTWTAVPMFNLLLRLDRFGRHVLTPDQRLASSFFGVTVALALGGLGWALAGGGTQALIATILAAALSIAVAMTFRRTGRQRKFYALATVGLACLAAGTLSDPNFNSGISATCANLFLFGFVGLQLLSNTLATI
jgi:tetratricopeptide (TPR) repeat protein